MKLTLLSYQEYTSTVLPEKCAGRYWVNGKGANLQRTNIVSVEAVRPAEAGGAAQWMVKSNRRFKIVDRDNNTVPSAALCPFEFYKIQSADGKLSFMLYTEPLSEDRNTYCCYELTKPQAALKLGRGADNGISYGNKFVSDVHAELLFSADGAAMRDLESTNKTYVNGIAAKQKMLKNGDVIYIMGMQIIVSGRLLFINNPDGKVLVQSEALRKYQPPAFEASAQELEEDESAELAREFYYRAPRFKYDVETFELKLDAPPANQNQDEVPMLMLIGPSITMGMASAASAFFAVSSAIGRGDIGAALPSIVMSVSMLLGTLMWPTITKRYQKKLRERKEQRRQETYQEYLMQTQALIAQETERQEEILRANDVNAAGSVGRILAQTPQIWERTPKHTDFLSMRLGFGNLPLKANIQYSERRFTVERDNLTELMYQFGEKKRMLSDVPICLPLAERFVSGIYAEKKTLFCYARSLILQLAALHSYDEVKLVLLYDEADAETFSFTRYLPHTMDDARTVRYIATNPEEAKALSASLDSLIEYRKALGENRMEDETPYFVVLCLSKELAAKAECVRRIQEHKDNLKFSVVAMFERLKDLPKECSAVVELHPGQGGKLTRIGDVSEPPIPFQTDTPQQLDIERITAVLANTEVDITGSNFALPRKYSFLEMLGVGMIEHINLTENWLANDPTKSLAATIGVDRYGEPFKLDLHERAHGPHGLVAGMTGSGKSEFIIAYILSMAVSYHPYEVAFILIDYKGGGMAESFKNIPHTAGIITNLDGNGITRSLASMRSELHRRERIFKETSQQHNVSNIDIYKYQKLFREGKVSEPLPHLFIISDEFAELKKEQPEFMSELTSTARVGRSLGVHLILATQKPGGVVDDQIRSNSRFRVCLKVQDNGDSTEMLGRTEAAALVDTGRFYLQVGNNELFEIGQSAWAGAPYYPSPTVIKDRDDAVSVIDTNGRVIAEANTDRFALVKDPPKQLDVVTGYIGKISEEEQIQRWKMWLDPIPALIFADALTKKYAQQPDAPFELNPVVGELDDPSHQRQDILRVPLTRDGNVIVYGSTGSGKSMFLEAMCCSLITAHTPQEVNLYLMDFGAETLKAFAAAPHVGDVILSYEEEKVNNLFKLMLGKLETRKKLLSSFGGDMAQYNRQAQKPEPSLIVMIHNYAAFTELFEDRAAELSYLTREGTKYGIYFVLTCTGVNNVRFGLLQNFKSLYCLQLNNPDDYSSVVGKTGGMLPEKHKGRGLVRLDKDSLLEFQTASVSAENPPYAAIRALCAAAAARYADAAAVRVPVLPERVREEELAAYIKKDDYRAVPIGIDKSSLAVVSYDLAARPVHLLLSLNQEWQQFMHALAAMLKNRYAARVITCQPEDAEGCAAAVHEIFNEVLTRNNAYKDSLEEGGGTAEFEPLFVFIPSMSRLRAALSRCKAPQEGEKEADDDTLINRLTLAMEKNQAEYAVHFVVAESLNLLTPFTVEPWYKTHVSGNDGIWVGSGVNTQYRLNISKKPQDYTAELGSDFGFAIKNAAASVIKLLQ